MPDNEAIYTIPLRKAKEVQKNRRAPYAIRIIKDYIARHMKVDEENVWIDNRVNEYIWARGIEKIPPRIRVKATKFEEDGLVEVVFAEDNVSA